MRHSPEHVNMASDVQNLAESVNNLQTGVESTTNGHYLEEQLNSESEGMEIDLKEKYRLAVDFYKAKEGSKALQISYKDKLKMVALTKQVAYGRYRPEVSPEVGFLDVVGNDRRQAWQTLGDLSREAAMVEFTENLARLCAMFTPYLQAHHAEKVEQNRRRLEEEARIHKESEEQERQKLQEAQIMTSQLQDRAKQQLQEQAWQTLGDLSREAAMVEFTENLARLCAMFTPYLQAHHAEKVEQNRRRLEEEARIHKESEEQERQKLQEAQIMTSQLQDRAKQQLQEAQIRAALNQQTAITFRQYAQEQHANDQEKQEALIQQLQEQHYQQYMQQTSFVHTISPPQLQVYQQQLQHQQQQYAQLKALAANSAAQQQQQVALRAHEAATGGAVPLQVTSDGDLKELRTEPEMTPEHDGDDTAEIELNENGLPSSITSASMWTRKDLAEFKGTLSKDKDSIIRVGSGETVTVRVPTHEDGSCLFWEFATDNYDIGFGVYFEWTTAPSNQVSVHVSESSDEEDIEEEGQTPGGEKAGDVERGAKKKQQTGPPTDEIIPVYRRDSHEEVYCGSHMYPGRGVYLLKFDNSYSLWRSKQLYYRVYYTR